jgi:hypothetical protein
VATTPQGVRVCIWTRGVEGVVTEDDVQHAAAARAHYGAQIATCLTREPPSETVRRAAVQADVAIQMITSPARLLAGPST